MVIKDIRRHIEHLPPQAMFSTRELLAYGKRASVDSATYRLVHGKEIIRITPGLFMRNSGSNEIPPVWDIVCAKAKAFARKVFRLDKDVASAMGRPLPDDNEVYFLTDGSSTSFRIQRKLLVNLVKSAPRKNALGDTKVALQLRSAWRLGEKNAEALKVQMFVNRWSASQMREAAGRTAELSSWLADMVGLPRRDLSVAPG